MSPRAEPGIVSESLERSQQRPAVRARMGGFSVPRGTNVIYFEYREGNRDTLCETEG